MKAYEFPGKVTAEGKIELPDAILQKLLHNQQVKVIILVDELSEEQEEEKAWKSLAAEQLLKGYCEEDSIYDAI
jgi:predicted AAA+ superfamily ATPase